MKMRKTIALILGVSLFLVLLTACGGQLSGTYENIDGSVTWSFSGKNYELTFIDWRGNYVSETGTYSITGDQIELTFIDVDGPYVYVCDFSRTENTIVIDGTRYTRQR